MRRIRPLLLPVLLASLALAESPATRPAVYSTTRPSPDGIGKVYMGREIAKVMGHLGADWLERPTREREERPSVLINRLRLKPTDTVADIGCGSGYFSLRMAKRVPKGEVLAVDIQPEMLNLLMDHAARQKIENVTPILGEIDDPKLPPNSVDLALFVDAYHEFDHPHEMMTRIAASLTPTGRVALVEYRAEDPAVAIKPLHKMTEAQAIKEMAAVGLVHIETDKSLPQQHLMFFRKAAPSHPAVETSGH